MKKGFQIAARALRQLGAELITSDEIALNELIKNAADAHSPRVRVEINAPADAAMLEAIADDLERSMLSCEQALEKISRCFADGLDVKTRATDHRLFHQAAADAATLGQYIRRFLRDNFFIRVIDTGDGMTADDLENAFLVIGTPRKWTAKREGAQSSGTLLGEKGIGRLSMMRLGRFAVVASSPAPVSVPVDAGGWHQIKFDWQEFDDPDLMIGDIEIPVTACAPPDNSNNGTVITISSLNAHWTLEKANGFIEKYLRRLQHPFIKNSRPYPIDIIFNGRRLPIPSIPKRFVEQALLSATYTFAPQGSSADDVVLRRTLKWKSAETEETRDWSAGELMSQLEADRQLLISLGSLEANCLWYNRQRLTSAGVDVSSKQIRDELNLWCGGFAIYRDGFRVGETGGMEDDWLSMDTKALRGKGYTLNRYQTVGALTISSLNNPRLVDAANRESLVSCPEYETLKKLLGVVVTNDLRSHINTAKEVEVKIAISEETTEESLRRSERDLNNTLKMMASLERQVPKEHREKIAEVRNVLREQSENVQILQRALEIARETRTEILELAGIGLVVEMVIHELVRLTGRTSELLGEIDDKSNDPAVAKVVDTLRAQVISTNKRIRTVDALSPSGRNRKEEFDIVRFTQEILDGYEIRFKRHAIRCHLLVDGQEAKKPIGVNMVRGLVAQVLENLISNSIYWLQQALEAGATERELELEIDSKALTITVTDNGPGIDPRYSKEVFRPYFTTRKKGKGLGLFIAAELTEYHGGQLYLDTSPGADGRLRSFVLELPRK